MRAGVDDQVARGQAVVRRRNERLLTIGQCFAPLVGGAFTVAGYRGRHDRAHHG